MAPTDNTRALTELEGATLGVIVRDGPCTAYAVKEMFRASPSGFWSGSAGSIYPLVKRLAQRGLVKSASGATGRRGHRSYRVTPAGRRAFAHWMIDAERIAGVGYDPLRTRLVFLTRLGAGKQEAFREAASSALRESQPLSGIDDPYLDALDNIWRNARLHAFEKIISALGKQK